jgi:hypothetical protein
MIERKRVSSEAMNESAVPTLVPSARMVTGLRSWPHKPEHGPAYCVGEVLFKVAILSAVRGKQP